MVVSRDIHMTNHMPLPAHAASACGSLLKRPWRCGETGQQRNEALEYLLKYHVTWNEDPLGLMEEIMGGNVVELMGEEAHDASDTYPTLTKLV